MQKAIQFQKKRAMVANTLEGKSEKSSHYADLTTRSLRILFVIREDLDKAHLLEIIKYNSIIWGGYYNCMIPTDGERIEEKWWDVLERYNPDKIVFCGDKQDPIVSDKLSTRIQNEIQPFSIEFWNSWDKDQLEIQAQGFRDWLGSIPMISPMQHFYDNLRTPVAEKQSNIRIPKIDVTHPLYLCLISQVGIADGFYDDFYTNYFKAETIEFTTNDLGEYLSKLSEFHGRLSPFLLTHHSLSLHFHSLPAERPEGLLIVIIGPKIVHDICTFWNLHLSMRFTYKNPQDRLLILPKQALRSEKAVTSLTENIKGNNWHSHNIFLISSSLSAQALKRFQARLENHLSRSAKIKIIKSPFISSFFFETKQEEHEEITSYDQTFNIRVLKPAFFNHVKSGEWVVDIKFKPILEYPLSSKINHLLCGNPSNEVVQWLEGYWLKYDWDRISARVNTKTNFIKGHFVDPIAGFKAVFEDKGFVIQSNDRHAYTEGFQRLIGNLKLLEDEGVRKLLWDMARKEQCFTIGQARGSLKGSSNKEEIIEQLIANMVLLRGTAFTCVSCGLERWYPLNTLDEVMQCEGCLKLIRPPSDIVIKVRLNELASKAVNQGAIAVLLTKRALDQQLRILCDRLYVYGTEIHNNSLPMTDFDLITNYTNSLILAECKEYKDGINKRQKKELSAQFQKLITVAKQLGKPILIFSTLLPPEDQNFGDIANMIIQVNRKSKLPINLLSLKKMGFVNLQEPTEILEYPNLFQPI